MKKAVRARRAPISGLTTRRLSVYLRCLELLETGGVEEVSSKAMAEQFQLNSAQFRKDLATFGEFGVRGRGYRVADLKAQLIDILGLGREIRLAIVGAGNLGMALADYPGFNFGDLRMVALFDADRDRIGGMSRLGVPIHDSRRLSEIIAELRVDIVLLAVPASAGQAALDSVARAGVRAVLNFVPVRLKVPAGVQLKTVDLKVQVESLVFHLPRPERRGNPPARASSAR